VADQFDELAKALAEGVSRREALRRLGGGLASALLASLGLRSAWAAQACFDPKPRTGCETEQLACYAEANGLCQPLTSPAGAACLELRQRRCDRGFEICVSGAPCPPGLVCDKSTGACKPKPNPNCGSGGTTSQTAPTNGGQCGGGGGCPSGQAACTGSKGTTCCALTVTCCDGICCAPGATCVAGQCVAPSTDLCYAYPGTTACYFDPKYAVGASCCPSGTSCCHGACIAPGDTCCQALNGAPGCCPPGSSCCAQALGTVCCPTGWSCVLGNCMQPA
jgi:hypothetical protein